MGILDLSTTNKSILFLEVKLRIKPLPRHPPAINYNRGRECSGFNLYRLAHSNYTSGEIVRQDILKFCCSSPSSRSCPFSREVNSCAGVSCW